MQFNIACLIVTTPFFIYGVKRHSYLPQNSGSKIHTEAEICWQKELARKDRGQLQ